MTLGRDRHKTWYENANVGIEVGPTGAQFEVEYGDTLFVSRFSGGDIVEKCVQADAEYLVIWAKDGEFAYYNSKIVPKAPGLGKRDILRESIEAGRSHELPIIAYCELQHPVYLLRKHPEYRMLDIEGKEIDGRVCFNSGYIHHIKQVVAEIMSYGIDGFHFDMMDQGFINSYGDGKVVYLPCSPDAAIASEYRTAEPRFLIRNAIRYLNPEPDVEVSAPLNVESVITEDEKNRILRIHLISYLSPAASTGPGRPHSNFILPCPMEEAPIYRAKITVRRPFREFSALSPDPRIEILSNGIELLVSDVHETIVMRY